MRLIDVLFRQGHLSEQALTEAVITGSRPHHLDRCDVCAERFVQLASWLDETKEDAVGFTDTVFTPERLAAGQHQILRRLEQLDQPARVISFPAASRHESPAGGRRVSVSWVGVAAAAGLVLGLFGGQITARMSQVPNAPTTAATSVAEVSNLPPSDLGGPGNPAIMGENFETLDIESLRVIGDVTPKFRR